MPYWLTNPDHGTMPVYDMGEVERVKKFGWTLLNVGESPIPVAWSNKADPSEITTAFATTLIASPVVEGGIGGSRAIAASPDSFTAPVVAKRKPGRPPKAK
jgi:hypothetical protein